ncbi:MAG: hypothetical protein ACO1OG_01455, partial [Devosia sp.]
IGMAAGKVVFDGTPDQLTTDVARQLYGADGLKEAFSEEMTSTSLEAIEPKTKKKKPAEPTPTRRQSVTAPVEQASLPN